MLRSYRGIILAFGLILLGAGEPRNQQSKEQGAQSDLTKAAATVSAAITSLKVSTEKNPSCDPRGEDRNSDLCAQWKAADAARDAANYAWLAILLGFSGTVLLVLTLWETRKTSRAELRAYLFLDAETPIGPFKIAVGEAPSGMIHIKNFGQTPAYGIVCQRGTMDGPWPIPDDFCFPEDDTYIIETGASLPPGATTSFPIFKEGQSVSQKAFDEIMAGSATFYIWGRIKYRDVFGRLHRTNFCLGTDPNSVDKNYALRRSARQNDAT